MRSISTSLPGVFVLDPRIFIDDRGCFFECYSKTKFSDLGIHHEFVQDNQSRSRRGVLRGLHYQLGSHPQAKLVRVVSGEVFDVAVDIRRGSPTFGSWVGERLSAENRKQMYIPAGFAHGFYTMTETAEVAYKASDYYAPAEERGIHWSDPAIGIQWPMWWPPVLSAKDKTLPTIGRADLPVYEAC